ncbi:MAG: hypothetical protein ACE5JS_17060 [Nitrospinota bacterium]
MSKRYGRGLTALGAMALCMEAAPAAAHAFGERYDLPVPLWLYLIGAGAAVVLSFVVMALFVRGAPELHGYPRFNLLRWRAGRLLAHSYTLSFIRLLSVSLFILILAAGLFGNQDSLENIAPTLVWVLWWVGMAYVCALLGDVWALINPWRVLFSWSEALYLRVTRKDFPTFIRPYPERLGYWPAVVLFLGYAWIEIVWHGGETPANIAILSLVYSVITWSGMIVFGKEEWLRRGEVFSVVFGLLARFAPMEMRGTNPATCASCPSEDCGRDGSECLNCYACLSRVDQGDWEWNLRPHAVGLLTNRPIHPSLMVFVVLMLSTVTFDGFTETPVWAAILNWFASAPFLRSFLLGLQSKGLDLLATIETAALVVFPILFLLVYLIFSRLIAVAAGSKGRLQADAVKTEGPSVGEIARFFVFSLIPIAIAYHLAHYLSFLLIAGQLAIPLASDPFGFGWDLFGTVNYRFRLDIVDARFVWITAVSAIVAGHIVAVIMAHVMALRVFNNNRTALRSQYPMLLLMIAYTVLSLWILAQPVVKSGPGG